MHGTRRGVSSFLMAALCLFISLITSGSVMAAPVVTEPYPSGTRFVFTGCGPEARLGAPRFLGLLPKNADPRTWPEGGIFYSDASIGQPWRPILKDLQAFIREKCPEMKAPDPYQAWLYTDKVPALPPDYNLASVEIGQGPTFIVIRSIAAVRDREKKAREAAQAAAAATEAATKKKLGPLFSRYGVTAAVDTRALGINPFAFEGKTVLLMANLVDMVNATTAVFAASDGRGGFVVVTDIPRGTIADQADFVVVGKVVGKTKWEGNPLGNPMTPHLKFIAIQRCKTREIESCI